RISFVIQSVKLFGSGPRFAGNAGHRFERVLWSYAAGRSGGLEEAHAPVVIGYGGVSDERAKRVQLCQRCGHWAIKRIKKHLAPSASRGINQGWSGSGSDP